MSHPAQGQPRALGSRRLSRHERKPSGESGHAAPSREKGVDGSVSGAGAKGVAGDTAFRVLGPGGRLSSQVERHPRALAGGSGLRYLHPAGGASTGRGRVGFPFCRHLHGEDSHPGGGRGRASRRRRGNVSHSRAARTSRDSKAFPPLGVRLANRVTRIPLPLTRFEKELTGGRTLRWDGKKHTWERA